METLILAILFAAAAFLVFRHLWGIGRATRCGCEHAGSESPCASCPAAGHHRKPQD